MSDQKTDKQIIEAGGLTPNPESGTTVKPTTTTQPSEKPVEKSNSGTNIDEQIKGLTEKLDRLSNQYDGSTKEALRLKEENEKLKAQIAAVGTEDSTISEKKFQSLVEENGLMGAIDKVFGGKVNSLEKRVETLLEKESKKIYNDFVATHPALKEATVNQKFEAELSKLKDVYTDVFEAMEKAYILAGGTNPVSPVPPNTVKSEEVSKNNEQVIKSVVGAESDQKPGAVTQQVDPAKTIQDLRQKATALELQGKVRQAAEIYAKIEDLKATIANKV